jgi:serine O-acetyltransferase
MAGPGREDQLRDIIARVVRTYDEVSTINQLGLRRLPSRDAVADLLERLKEVLYPGYFGHQRLTRDNIHYHIGDQVHEVCRLLAEQIYLSVQHECRRTDRPECPHCRTLAADLSVRFLERVPELRRRLAGDVRAAYDGDPAARSLDEIIFSYPGVAAITVYRIAHELWDLDVPLLPRIMAEIAHGQTGIDIHPGARIGENFFIDHGTGVVIGETAEIGHNVKLYQGVTLGALSFPKDEAGRLLRGHKRHPTIGDNVTIYSGATLLGGETVVGEGSTIGGNVWLTHAVPPHSFVRLEEPGLVVAEKKGRRGAKPSAPGPAPAR